MPNPCGTNTRCRTVSLQQPPISPPSIIVLKCWNCTFAWLTPSSLRPLVLPHLKQLVDLPRITGCGNDQLREWPAVGIYQTGSCPPPYRRPGLHRIVYLDLTLAAVRWPTVPSTAICPDEA